MNKRKPRTITANQVEEGDTQVATVMVPVTISANQLEKGDSQAAYITVEQAVEIESRIPPDAKQAVTDFIKEQISQFDEALGEFIINFPDHLTPFIEAILDIVKLVTGWG